MGGQAADVYGLSLGLSLGDIQDPLCIEHRIQAHKILWAAWNKDIHQQVVDLILESSKNLQTIHGRIAAGEDARICTEWKTNSRDHPQKG